GVGGLKVARAPSMPASTSAATRSSDAVAGPNVQTIFARRLIARPYRERAAATGPEHVRTRDGVPAPIRPTRARGRRRGRPPGGTPAARGWRGGVRETRVGRPLTRRRGGRGPGTSPPPPSPP